jgi:signal transduction histidine kinase
MSVGGPGTGAAAASRDAITVDRHILRTASALVLAPCVLFAAALVLLLVTRGQGAGLGYESRLKTLAIVLGLLVPLGVIAALVLVLRERPGETRAKAQAASAAAGSRLSPVRATSVATRAFVVILIVVLIPSFCLAAFGVWAYVKSWDRAYALYEGQATYHASLVRDEITGLSRSPARFPASERALLSTAIVEQAARYDQQNGAVAISLGQIRAGRLLAPVIVRALQHRGYALATVQTPDQTLVSRPDRADIVAWVGPGGGVYVYAPGWNGPLPRFAPYAPAGRLVRIGLIGMALTAVLGFLGSWILSRSVVRPVRRLAEASGRLADGEAGVTVAPAGPRELRDLALAFNEMNARMTKAQEAEQSFLLSVSHELKTPLTSIRGYAEALDDGALPPCDAAAVIENESARLERLVGDLLDSARMRKSAFAVRSERVDLAEVAREVARRYEGPARDAGLALNLELAPDSLAVADHDRVLQVVSNLVENAVRCTPAPGTVRVVTAAGLVSVADSGRGLTSDDLSRAFERFYLYSRYGHDRPIGTGLGLSIVKELTEAMGGSVRVTSAVGVGTAFFVELPAAAHETSAPPLELPPGPSEGPDEEATKAGVAGASSLEEASEEATASRGDGR